MPTEKTQANKPLSAPQKALRKMGLVRDVDLALHLPYRYEDETRLTRLADAREGEVVQFARGYGLSYARPVHMNPLPLPPTPNVCDPVG
jgi:hypothetical protein